MLAIAAAVVTVGWLGDMFGRRRIFIASFVLLAVGATIAGLAPRRGSRDHRGAWPAADRGWRDEIDGLLSGSDAAKENLDGLSPLSRDQITDAASPAFTAGLQVGCSSARGC
jgi:MFS family permease